ncbi:SH3 domain-containing protein [Anaerocolumna sp. AGMB13025]|uniref:C40 family peptidase n=1 Tax=Anaerocolumna sp. AGMB13025 TaxID=3039116 RepID=UPI00241C6C29|nr:C40 family peptidase [Anaerocolumna sp. AGMB13025]WFR55120.1 SH3 domain-containing protein [Anaerocolumna sp. AGMB13025]
MKKAGKIITYCMIGTIAFASQTVVTKAAELPIAGIDLLLNDFYQKDANENKDIKDYLSSSSFKELANISFAQVTDYVNIRKKPSEDGKILGKLYNNSAATIISKKNGWYKVKSGSVTGYIKAEYLATGTKAAELASKAGTRIATVNTATLKVRKNASTDAPVVTLVPVGEELKVKKETDGWIKVTVDNKDKGYVSSDYVDLSTVYKKAISIEEEQKKIKAEEAASQEQSSGTSGSSSTSGSSRSYQTKSASNSDTSSSDSSVSSGTSSSLRNKIVNYALKFEGNPYVWGGTSLTNGADCSGFTQSVFSDLGVNIPRDSRSQASSGKSKSISNIQPGDLIFYAKGGRINHVALYIGNGKVISAKSPEYGIKVANYDYRQPVKVVSYLN